VAIERDACLAPVGETWSMMLRQEAALDRSIDRNLQRGQQFQQEHDVRPGIVHSYAVYQLGRPCSHTRSDPEHQRGGVTECTCNNPARRHVDTDLYPKCGRDRAQLHRPYDAISCGWDDYGFHHPGRFQHCKPRTRWGHSAGHDCRYDSSHSDSIGRRDHGCKSSTKSKPVGNCTSSCSRYAGFAYDQ
jgi:hypothetical protein